MSSAITPSDFKRVRSDVNGNPRYVIHFLLVAKTYPEAIRLANSIGGRKYHNQSYGGGLVFQSYAVERLCTELNAIRTNGPSQLEEAIAHIKSLCFIAESAAHLRGLEREILPTTDAAREFIKSITKE